mgnify:CR=1 FL=1
MKGLISLVLLGTLIAMPVKYFSTSSNKSFSCNVFGICDFEIKDKSELLMKATAKSIIAKAHPTTTYQSYEFKRIEKSEKEFIAVYEIAYTSLIEGKLYLEVNIVFDKNTLDFIEIRRKSDTSKVPIIELDFSSIKELFKSFRF